MAKNNYNSRWLIAAFCDGQSRPVPTEEGLLLSDIKYYKEFSSKKVPAEPFILSPWVWIDINDIKDDYNKNKSFAKPLDDEKFINLNIIKRLIKRFNDNDCRELALIIDRNLFFAKGLDDLFLNLVRHRYFKSRYEPAKFAFCFGGIPVRDYIDPPPDNASVCNKSWRDCGSPSCSDFYLKTCKHTCYWRLLGMILGTHKIYQDQNNLWERDVGIAENLPKLYIYQ